MLWNWLCWLLYSSAGDARLVSVEICLSSTGLLLDENDVFVHKALTQNSIWDKKISLRVITFSITSQNNSAGAKDDNEQIP